MEQLNLTRILLLLQLHSENITTTTTPVTNVEKQPASELAKWILEFKRKDPCKSLAEEICSQPYPKVGMFEEKLAEILKEESMDNRNSIFSLPLILTEKCNRTLRNKAEKEAFKNELKSRIRQFYPFRKNEKGVPPPSKLYETQLMASLKSYTLNVLRYSIEHQDSNKPGRLKIEIVVPQFNSVLLAIKPLLNNIDESLVFELWSHLLELKRKYQAFSEIFAGKTVYIRRKNDGTPMEELLDPTKKLPGDLTLFKEIYNTLEQHREVIEFASLASYLAFYGESMDPNKCVQEMFFKQQFLSFLTTRKVVDKYGPSEEEIWELMRIGRSVEDAMYRKIQKTIWLSPESKLMFANKLGALTTKIAYPIWILDNRKLEAFYSEEVASLAEIQQLSLLDSLEKLGELSALRFLESIKRGKPRMTEWEEFQDFPMERNALYRTGTNHLKLSLGYAQWPYFGKTVPKSIVYGTVGVVLGHELGHGFGTLGRVFDLHGRKGSWVSAGETEEFKRREQCFIDQYSRFCFGEQYGCLNGRNTIREAVADDIGLELAYDAFQLVKEEQSEHPGLEEFSKEQIFFMAHARNYCQRHSDWVMKIGLKYSPFPPSAVRIDGSLRNHPHYAKAFNCKLGDPMAPVNPCSVW